MKLNAKKLLATTCLLVTVCTQWDWQMYWKGQGGDVLAKGRGGYKYKFKPAQCESPLGYGVICHKHHITRNRVLKWPTLLLKINFFADLR